MLEALPAEILSTIANWLSPRDLRFLSQASRRLHSVFIPLLYHTINFCAASEWALNVINIGTFFRLHKVSQDSCYLQYTRELSISAPIVFARFNRCTYFNVFRVAGQLIGINTLGTSNESKAHEQFLDDISHQLQLVQSHLKSNHLRSLEYVASPGSSSTFIKIMLMTTIRWGLGTCIPPGFLDLDGYIDRHQNGLSHISLVTDGTCPHSGRCLSGLGSLSSLNSLVWEGIGRPAEFDTLRKCILRNRKHLAVVSIGYVAPVATIDIYHDVFGKPVDEAQPYNGTGKVSIPFSFPCLASLTLSKAALPRNVRPKDARIFGSLKSLILRNCTNQITFMNSISRTPGAMQLEHLEFCYDSLQGYGEDRDVSPLVDFLLSLEGLKHLHLKLSNFCNTSQIQQAIEKHLSSLKSLAYHERGLVSIDDEGLFEDVRDKAPVWLSHSLWSANLCHATALAFSVRPSTIRSRLEPIARASNLQILHFRFSGSERSHRNCRDEILKILTGGKKCCPQYFDPEARFRYRSCGTIGRDLSTVMEVHAFESSEEDESYESGIQNNPVATISESEEFVDFADWAFGPKGLPALQILAFGDFSLQDRYHNQQFLVHRKRWNQVHTSRNCQGHFCDEAGARNFVVADVAEPSLWDSIEVNGPNFLSNCPESGLLESPYE
ncbi:hypothetical protein N7499_006308 [Penicillium canescens]|nr:hypothetical protein N7499_006308 [Penicillium canescens]KAJ6176770.1 hypothetical protein N7485_003684 [Penicillium canescens]